MRNSKVLPAVKAYAVSLREEGKTYSEIVTLCNQIEKPPAVTLDWCKRTLKDVCKTPDKSDAEASCIQTITNLALRPEGVTATECYGVIKTLHNFNDYEEYHGLVQDLYKKYKAKVKKTEGVLFRPSSIQPNNAQKSFNRLLELSTYLYEQIEDYLNDYKYDFPDVSTDMVKREIATLTFPELKLMGGVGVRCNYLHNSVEALKSRVEQNVDKQDVVVDNLFVIDTIDNLPF